MLFVAPDWARAARGCGGFVIAWLVHDARRLDVERVFLRLANSWYAVGPALVSGPPASRPRRSRAARLPRCAPGAVRPRLRQRRGLRAASRAAIADARSCAFVAWACAVDLALTPVGLLAAIVATEVDGAVVLLLPLLGLLSVFARERTARLDARARALDAYRGTAFLLGDVIEADDAYTGAHSRDVVDALARGRATTSALDARAQRRAELAALLHDVGKIRVPNEIINKPGPLDDAE